MVCPSVQRSPPLQHPPWTEEDKEIFRLEYKSICTFFSTGRSAELRRYEAVILHCIKMHQVRKISGKENCLRQYLIFPIHSLRYENDK